MITPKGFKDVNGFMWPEGDVDCAKVVFKMRKDLDVVLPFVSKENRGTCIQAGGNCGVFPVELSKHFDRVLTFEPHPQNFSALAFNTAGCPNVNPIRAALGSMHGNVELALADHETKNFGAFYVVEDALASTAPVLRIDDFKVDNLGLIYLDIEGFEFVALEGAIETIERHRPVIAIEDKGLSEKYGAPKGYVGEWLRRFGYGELHRVNRDVVYGVF